MGEPTRKAVPRLLHNIKGLARQLWHRQRKVHIHGLLGDRRISKLLHIFLISRNFTSLHSKKFNCCCRILMLSPVLHRSFVSGVHSSSILLRRSDPDMFRCFEKSMLYGPLKLLMKRTRSLRTLK